MGWFSRKELPSPQALGPHLLVIASAGGSENAVAAVSPYTRLSPDKIRLELLALRFFWMRLSAIMHISQSNAPSAYIGKIASAVDLMQYAVTNSIPESEGALSALGLVATMQAMEIAKRAGPSVLARYERASQLWSAEAAHFAARTRDYTRVFQIRHNLDDATAAMSANLGARGIPAVLHAVKEDFETTSRAVREMLLASGFKVR